jgi:hypothetical protein
MTQAVSDILTFITCLPFAIGFIREMNRLSAEQAEAGPEANADETPDIDVDDAQVYE